MKLKNVSVSLVDGGKSCQLHAIVTFSFPGELGKESPSPGFVRVSEAARRKTQKKLEELLSQIELPEVTNV